MTKVHIKPILGFYMYYIKYNKLKTISYKIPCLMTYTTTETVYVYPFLYERGQHQSYNIITVI